MDQTQSVIELLPKSNADNNTNSKRDFISKEMENDIMSSLDLNSDISFDFENSSTLLTGRLSHAILTSRSKNTMEQAPYSDIKLLYQSPSTLLPVTESSRYTSRYGINSKINKSLGLSPEKKSIFSSRVSLTSYRNSKPTSQVNKSRKIRVTESARPISNIKEYSSSFDCLSEICCSCTDTLVINDDEINKDGTFNSNSVLEKNGCVTNYNSTRIYSNNNKKMSDSWNSDIKSYASSYLKQLLAKCIKTTRHISSQSEQNIHNSNLEEAISLLKTSVYIQESGISNRLHNTTQRNDSKRELKTNDLDENKYKDSLNGYKEYSMSDLVELQNRFNTEVEDNNKSAINVRHNDNFLVDEINKSGSDTACETDSNCLIREQFFKPEEPAITINEKIKELSITIPPGAIYGQLRCPHFIYKGYLYQYNRVAFGEQTWNNGSRYIGSWKNDCAYGQGTFLHNNGDEYNGEWINNRANGNGTYTKSSGESYSGSWLNDTLEGYGTENWPGKGTFSGYYKDGLKSGEGKFQWKDGSYYEGNFEDNLMNGYGEYYWAAGRIYKGEWKNNKMSGKGYFSWPCGAYYKGNYRNDLRHGIGLYCSEVKKYFYGTWINGLRHGMFRVVDNSLTAVDAQYYENRRTRLLNGYLTNEEIYGDLPPPEEFANITLEKSTQYKSKTNLSDGLLDIITCDINGAASAPGNNKNIRPVNKEDFLDLKPKDVVNLNELKDLLASNSHNIIVSNNIKQSEISKDISERNEMISNGDTINISQEGNDTNKEDNENITNEMVNVSLVSEISEDSKASKKKTTKKSTNGGQSNNKSKKKSNQDKKSKI